MTARRLLLSAAAAAALALLGACDGKPGEAPKASFRGVDITGAEYAQKLELTDVTTGQPRALASLQGQVVLVFFGYTQCPDVCPTTMAELAEVKRSLGADGAKVSGVFVSVDPERDTPEVLKAYVANFGPDFIGLRGTPEQTRAAAKDFKVFYSKVPGKTDTSYTIDHTAGAYLFDPQGRVRVFVRYGSGAAALAEDIKTLLKAG